MPRRTQLDAPGICIRSPSFNELGLRLISEDARVRFSLGCQAAGSFDIGRIKDYKTGESINSANNPYFPKSIKKLSLCTCMNS